jgi:hypothetical protein
MDSRALLSSKRRLDLGSDLLIPGSNLDDWKIFSRVRPDPEVKKFVVERSVGLAHSCVAIPAEMELVAEFLGLGHPGFAISWRKQSNFYEFAGVYDRLSLWSGAHIADTSSCCEETGETHWSYGSVLDQGS